jgi:hypothetical protein
MQNVQEQREEYHLVINSFNYRLGGLPLRTYVCPRTGGWSLLSDE